MDIVDSIMHLLPSQACKSLASRLEVTPAEVEAGVSTSIAALLAALAPRSGETAFLAQIFELVKNMRIHSVLPALQGIASGVNPSSPVAQTGSRMTALLLHSQQHAIEEHIEHQSSLGAGAGSELMALAAPLAAGYLGQEIFEKGLTFPTFASMIRVDAAKLDAMLPQNFPRLSSSVVPAAPLTVAAATPVAKSSGGRWWFVIAILLLAGLTAWLASRGCNESGESTASDGLAPKAEANGTPEVGVLGAFSKRTLPDGTILDVPRLGIENKLIDFIEDKSRPADQVTWFDFDRLTFDTGKATLQSGSGEQLQNIAAILKAYPQVRVKVGGYTDNSGSKVDNLELSKERAANVQRALIDRGVDASRLDAQGYGDEHPVTSNDTAAGRQQNRRTSIRVTAK